MEASDHVYAVMGEEGELFSLDVAKWRGGRSGAVSITYDAPWGTHDDHYLATDAAIARGLSMDIEMVTWIFTQPKRAPLLETYHQELLSQGIHFFGHGHTHALHDTMTYEEAYSSFSTCFGLMTAWGFSPRAYAYPGSAGLLESTQRANREAGFICARGSTLEPDTWLLLADGATDTLNWQYLPSVPMGNGSYRYVQSHSELSPILDQAVERRAWVILMYHAIGIPEGWGYYPLDEFVADLDYIASQDLWCANLDRAALYALERQALQVQVATVPGRRGDYELTFSDGLPDEVYSEPLTAILRFGVLSPAQVRIDPPVGSGQPVPVVDGVALLDLLPADTPALLHLD
ncbi:hypothetical protein ACFL6X_03390 [Candidatus Latescibacterota bacterium]